MIVQKILVVSHDESPPGQSKCQMGRICSALQSGFDGRRDVDATLAKRHGNLS